MQNVRVDRYVEEVLTPKRINLRILGVVLNPWERLTVKPQWKSAIPIEERLRSELHRSEQGREITGIFALEFLFQQIIRSIAPPLPSDPPLTQSVRPYLPERLTESVQWRVSTTGCLECQSRSRFPGKPRSCR